jgi:uncharacterized protein YjbJ (UPF0337 family)
MITATLRETWGTIKAALKRKYANLTDNDLAYIYGREEEIINRIQEKTGASRDDLMRVLREDCGCNC